MAVEEIVDIGDERSALAAEGHVGWAKVRDSRDACARSDDGAFADLQRGGDGLAEIACRLALMENRLAVVANEVNAFGSDLESLASSKDSVGVNVPEPKV